MRLREGNNVILSFIHGGFRLCKNYIIVFIDDIGQVEQIGYMYINTEISN
jgi:hypothetical protein